MSALLENLLAICEDLGASDVHLAVDERPRFRVRGALVAKDDLRPFDSVAVDAIAAELGLTTLPVGTHEGSERVRLTLLERGSLDGAITAASGSRYRFNVYRESARHAVALRRLDQSFRSFDELGLPPRVAEFCEEPDGLVIVSGPTGSGKSTTLATMLDRINRNRQGHIITIEDPIEYVHQSSACLVNQRQVGRDTRSFNDALVEAMRQDPDVILVGEIRDLATIRTALQAAETGHLVFTTLHAGDCAGAVERLVSVFPADEQASARHQVALVLRGILAQHLLPSVDRSRRYAACELLINTPACANLIAGGRSVQLYSAIETGSQQGMKTLDASLAELLSRHLVEERAAMALSRNPELLKARLRRG